MRPISAGKHKNSPWTGRLDEAKAALAEARRLNPKLTAKWFIERVPNFSAAIDGLRRRAARGVKLAWQGGGPKSGKRSGGLYAEDVVPA